MASFDTGWTYTTAMYLNVPHNIRVTGTATRTSSTNVYVSGTFYLSRASGSYNYDYCKARLSNTSSWVQVKGYTTSAYSEVSANFSYNMTVGASDTSIKIQGIFAFFGSSGSSQVGNDARTSEAWPSLETAPSGLTVSNVVRGVDSFTATVSISSWGNGGSTSNRYRELQVWTNSSSGLVEPRRYQPQYGSDLSGTITCNNDSSGTLTIAPNTMYVIGSYATNGAMSVGSTRYGQFSTLPSSLTAKSATATSASTATVSFSTGIDGNQYPKRIQWSLDNSSWTDGATVSTGSAYSGSFEVSGLTPGTAATIYLRVTTDAGSTASGTVSVTTDTTHRLYGSRLAIADASATLGSQSLIDTFNKNDMVTFAHKLLKEDLTAPITHISIAFDSSTSKVSVTVSMSDGNSWSKEYNKTSPTLLVNMLHLGLSGAGLSGVVAGTVTDSRTDSVTVVSTVHGITVRIKKLYGSVNGVTKHMVKLYGSVNGKTKRII